MAAPPLVPASRIASRRVHSLLQALNSIKLISIETELLSPGLKLSGPVRISTAERESRSPLFSLSGNDPVCHPHAGVVCLGGYVKVTTGAFFSLPSSQRSNTCRTSSTPCLAWAENNCAVTAVSEHAARVSRSTRSESRRLSLSALVCRM